MLDLITQYEHGDLGPDDTVALFAELIRSGLIYQLQGAYQRRAQDLVDLGYIDPDGNAIIFPEG